MCCLFLTLLRWADILFLSLRSSEELLLEGGDKEDAEDGEGLVTEAPDSSLGFEFKTRFNFNFVS